MDYIFKDWEKKMSAFESSVEKDLAEIRGFVIEDHRTRH